MIPHTECVPEAAMLSTNCIIRQLEYSLEESIYKGLILT